MFVAFVISFILTLGSLSTYHKWLNKLFGKTTEDSWWFNWLAYGLGIGLAILPVTFLGISWYLIVLRAIVLGLAMMVWSELNDNAVWEECGRGVLIILTLPILFM